MKKNNTRITVTLGENSMKNNQSQSTSVTVFKKGSKATPKKKVNLPNGTYRAVNDLYIELKRAINTRHKLDEEQDRLWEKVWKGAHKKEEISKITNKIGAQTYKIDCIIHKLLKNKKNRKAIKLAIDFLEGERRRADMICRRWQRNIEKVKRGDAVFRNGNGQIINGLTNAKKYLKKKQLRMVEIDKLLVALRY